MRVAFSVDPTRTDNIERAFSFYVQRVYPGAKLAEIQLRELRQAFYAGVTWCLSEMHAMGAKDVPADLAVVCMQALSAECRAFGQATGIAARLQ